MRKRSENSGRNYFTQETEDYIIRYNLSTDVAEKNKIFTEHLYFPFYKLAENIIHTFKFYHTDVESIEDLKLDIIRVIVEEKIGRFDPTRGAKAYSYFGTIIKRWLIAYCNSNYAEKTKKISLDSCPDTFGETKHIETSPTLSLSAFMDMWCEQVERKIDDLFSKEDDRKIAEAVITVFKTRRDLQIFKKKALYVYVREITNCETPYLTKVILKLKEDFYKTYRKYLDEGLISTETDED